MPRGLRLGEGASVRMITLLTPREHAAHRALAKHLGVPLSDLVRSLLDGERARLERAGERVPKRVMRARR